MTNRKFTEDEHFAKCCAAADVGPTKRQASKFRANKGIAYVIGKPIVRAEQAAAKEKQDGKKEEVLLQGDRQTEHVMQDVEPPAVD